MSALKQKSVVAAFCFSLAAFLMTAAVQAETLENVSSWQDVSTFLQRHNISPTIAREYAVRSCEALPAYSLSVCFKETLSDPRSYNGLSTEWAADLQAKLDAQMQMLLQAIPSHAQPKLQDDKLRGENEARKTRHIEHLKQQIKNEERARKEVLETREEMLRSKTRYTADERQQIEAVLSASEAQLSELRGMLAKLQSGE